MKYFKCDFGGGLVCSVEASDQPDASAAANGIKVTWSGDIANLKIREYISWMNTVNKTLSDEWKRRVVIIYSIDATQTEEWIFTPGKDPECFKSQIV